MSDPIRPNDLRHRDHRSARSEDPVQAQDSAGPGVFVPPPLQFGAAVAAGVLLDGNLGAWRHPAHLAQLTGIFVAVVGLILIATCLGLFRRFRTRPEPWQPDQALIVSGVYKLGRNPMYLGMAILCLGIAIFFESLAGFILLGIALAVIDRYVVAREEAYLKRRFGTDYDAYRANVRRWL